MMLTALLSPAEGPLWYRRLFVALLPVTGPLWLVAWTVLVAVVLTAGGVWFLVGRPLCFAYLWGRAMCAADPKPFEDRAAKLDWPF